MRDDPPNPYVDLRLRELGDALMQRAGDLLDNVQVGRRDTAHLLIAAGHVVRPKGGSPNSPSVLAKTSPVAAAERFAEILADERRSLRWWLVRQAIDAFYGTAGQLDHDVMGLAPDHHRAVESDEACIEVIRALAARAGQHSELTKN